MNRYKLPEIDKGVYAVGAKDRNRKAFDALIPLHRGTSFNSYVVKGETGTALIDTVGPGFESELMEKVSQLLPLSSLDYIVMNHAEPDHSLAIPGILNAGDAVLIVTEKGAGLVSRFYNIPPERMKIVKEGDRIELGGKTLQFVAAPWLHWPETMMTYLVESKLLFSCDFFGAHTADGIYDSDVENLISLAKGYFGEIMMPLRAFCRKGMENVGRLDISMIAPSHGPVYRDPERILVPYRSWVAGDTREKAILAYATMWQSTEAMINTMSETLAAAGIEVRLHNILDLDSGDLAEDLVDSRAIVIGSPTVLSSVHPLVSYAMSIISLLKPPLKYGAFLNSYGWGKGAAKHGLEFFEKAKIEAVGAVEIQGHPQGDDYSRIVELGSLLAEKIKQS